MLRRFREFAMRGNVLDTAIGVILGAAFGNIVSSLVSDMLMPPLGLLVGNVDFSNLYLSATPYGSLAEAKAAGPTTLNSGVFLNAVIDFLLVALAIFVVVQQVNRLERAEAPAAPSTRECPHCLSQVPVAARRCAHCTAEIAAT